MKQRQKAHNYASAESILSNFAGRPVKYFLIAASVISVLFPVYWRFFQFSQSLNMILWAKRKKLSLPLWHREEQTNKNIL